MYPNHVFKTCQLRLVWAHVQDEAHTGKENDSLRIFQRQRLPPWEEQLRREGAAPARRTGAGGIASKMSMWMYMGKLQHKYILKERRNCYCILLPYICIYVYDEGSNCCQGQHSCFRNDHPTLTNANVPIQVDDPYFQHLSTHYPSICS